MIVNKWQGYSRLPVSCISCRGAFDIDWHLTLLLIIHDRSFRTQALFLTMVSFIFVNWSEAQLLLDRLPTFYQQRACMTLSTSTSAQGESSWFYQSCPLIDEAV